MDAKRSPLALLAQTCSQIGADPLPPSGKSSDKTKKDISVGSSAHSSSSSSSEGSGKSSKTPPAMSKHMDSANRREEAKEEGKSGFKSPTSASASSTKSTISHSTASLLSSSGTTSATTSTSTDSLKMLDAQRSALDALQLPKDVPLGAYRPTPTNGVFSSMPVVSMASYAGLEAATAAALGLGGFRHPYPHLGALSGYPPVSLGLSLAGYPQLNYGRLAAAPAGKGDPMGICRDPYCTGCPSSVLGAGVPVSSASGPSGCPAGCTQCDHQKTPTSSSTPTSTASSFSPTGASASTKPYVCNWIAGDNYCGKRFTSSEELLQHLRSHTSLSSVVSSASVVYSSASLSDSPSSVSSYTSSPLLNPALHPHSHLFAAQAASASALHRSAYPTPPLSPLSMARYHPYSKPSAQLTGPSSNPLASLGPNPQNNPLVNMSQSQLAALGISAGPLGAPNPLSLSPYAAAAAAAAAAAGHPGLSAYYSHPAYTLYSQRLGAGVLP